VCFSLVLSFAQAKERIDKFFLSLEKEGAGKLKS